MKLLSFLPILFLFISCANNSKTSTPKKKDAPPQEIRNPEFQSILDAQQVNGSILVYDLKNDTFYSNNFDWAREGNLPASTFKIVNSIIALETKVVENDSTLFEWDGEPRNLKSWEQDLVFRDAFHYSCVPCYQEIARNIGSQKMNQYLEKLDFGEMVVDSNDIDLFWLVGDSKINQFEQIDFLKRFYSSQLPISKRTEMIMKNMMVIEENDTFKISGKTGWSIRNGNNRGWFVGYIELTDQTYFFATNITPQETFDMAMFPRIRKEITMTALRFMELIE